MRLFNLLFLIVLLSSPVVAEDRPNIVFILADDMGWSDLGCYGADLYETPNIDSLASGGVKFTDAYAMPVCSPTRAALLTGRHAARVQMTIWSENAFKGGPQNRKLLEANAFHSLPHSETTLAVHLQKAGYLTALVGKWHLGDADHYPETHGFDVNIGGARWGAPQTFWYPYRGEGYFGTGYRYVPGLEFGKPGEYLTDRLTDEALTVIDNAGETPFFLYLSHHAPHTPIEAKAEDVKYFESKLRPEMKHQNAVYAGMLKSLDEGVGRVLAKLTDRGLDKNTVVIFASDNGGFIGVDRKSGQTVPATNNAPLRSGKGSCYEGGIRVPMIVHWPGVTTRGAVCREPVIVMDLLPTLLAATGIELPDDVTIDGLNLTPLLKDSSGRLDRDALHFHYPHYYSTTTPVSAIRSGDWKLLEYYEDNRVELFNLKEDLGETTDLAIKHPQRTAQLRKQLQRWRDEVGAQEPRPNPHFKPRKSGNR